MTEKFKSKRVAKLELKVSKDNPQFEALLPLGRTTNKGDLVIEIGALFTSPYPGNLGVSLTLPSGETGENGYPVRERLQAVKSNTHKVDISECFINAIVYEAIDARPPYED
jgi:hypothetical protein